MKILLVVLTMFLFSLPAAAQQFYNPCLVDVQDYKLKLGPQNQMVWPPPPRPAPIWEPVRLAPSVYKINGGQYWQLPIVMPVAGNCVGSYDAYDDRDDLAVVVTDALGRYIRKQPPGDIEIIIVDEFGFAEMNRGRSYSAYYSSGRQFSGNFDVPLRAGYYRLLISNKHSYLARKSVTFTLGQGEQRP